MDENTYIVLGSNSFSGSDFVDYLLDDPDKKVIGISRSPEKNRLFLPYKKKPSSRLANFKFFQMDLNHDLDKILDLLDEFKPAYIVNFAAQSEVLPSWDHPEHWYQTNGVGMVRFANSLKDRKYIKRFMHISSPEIYGACSGKVTEKNAPINPSTPYAASRAACDLFLFTLVKAFAFPLIVIRPTNVYGAHQQLFKIIPRTIIDLKMGKKVPLHGGGGAVKSYIHIRDVSAGELLALSSGRPGEIYHLSPFQGYSIKNIVEKICNIMGFDPAQSAELVGERLGQDAAYVIDSGKARRELNWSPEINIETGLKSVIEWVEENWSAIENEPKEYFHKP